uniref:uncharacterized protein n=1 Tax=Myxine glutinosa TaxID=7769 RepID=UPI00358ED4DD
MQAEENLTSAAVNAKTSSSCPQMQQGETAGVNVDCSLSHSGFHRHAQPHAAKVTGYEPLCTAPPEGSLAFDEGSTPASLPCPESDAAARNDLRTRGKSARRRRVCKYFLAGGCFYGDRCHFAHPPHADLPPLGGAGVSVDARRRTIATPRRAEQKVPSVGAAGSASDRGNCGRPLQCMAKGRKYRPPMTRPPLGVQPLLFEGLTSDAVEKLRETEITQLGKRFPGDKLIKQERDDGKVTFYRFTVNPTDPDWPFDIINLDVMVSFPENYPLEVFQVTIPEDQDLPSIMGRHVEKSAQDWLQAKHATVQLLGQLELLFRPFLRWLDRNMERLFTEGARLLKRELAAERAGIQFIPFRDLSGTKSTSPPRSPLVPTQDAGSSTADVAEEAIEKEPSQEDCESHDEESTPYEHDDCEEEVDVGGARDGDGTPATTRKGTEVKLLGLTMGEDAGILIAQSLTLLLQCNRCKAKEEVRVNAEGASSAECSKCHVQLSAKAHFSTAHHHDSVLAKLNLQFCRAVELLLQTSQLALTCLHCSLEHPLVGLCYGVKREFNCRHCHRRLSVLIEGARLHTFEPELQATANSAILKPKNYIKGTAFQPGKPLPENGTCKHYKKSFRWLRFPCCGRAYPCDICHNEDQSHEMEQATRMICGFCAREQPYSNGKACLGCGSFMTSCNFTPHWEGGQGCRNRIKMSRKDKQKYSNTNKTVSRKATTPQAKK